LDPDANEDEGDEIDLTKSGFAVKQDSSEYDFLCLTAKTALMLPFKWSDPEEADLQAWFNSIMDRKIRIKKKKEINIWKEHLKLSPDINDLDPNFRAGLGIYDGNVVDNDNLTYVKSKRLIMTHEALSYLFPHTVLVANDLTLSKEAIYKPIEVSSVEIVSFRLGTAVLIFHVNWLLPGEPLFLDELRTWLFLSKFRNKVKKVFQGWILNVDPDRDANSYETESLGNRMCKTLFGKKIVSLTTLGNWLLSKTSLEIDKPIDLLGRFLKRCIHHTVVVINKKTKQRKII